ncbi:MAG: spermidine/putrescine ABC transporter substrate-binding protein, partial [bacterium]|nr:spermidine/putrescine ABC transporter substrate-binding protein [bacterium]
MRKTSFVSCLLLLIALIAVPVFAQDAAPEATAAAVEPWVCPEGYEGQTLNIYNWSLYIGENTVPDFERLCGVTVNYDVYVSNEELFARIREGNPGYDIAVPTGYMVENLIATDLLVPLDMSKIPNFANVSEDLTNTPYDPGNVYSVPYQWGTVGIAYNRERVGKDITSWEDMWTYDGPVAWLEDVRGMLGIALINMGEDPNTTDPALIEAARDYLIERGDNVAAIVNANSQELLETGTVDMAVDYPGNTFQLQAKCECDDYQYVIPVEGTNAWMDNVVVLK